MEERDDLWAEVQYDDDWDEEPSSVVVAGTHDLALAEQLALDEIERFNADNDDGVRIELDGGEPLRRVVFLVRVVPEPTVGDMVGRGPYEEGVMPPPLKGMESLPGS